MGELGVKEGTVALVPYDTAWTHDFEIEKQTLMDALGDAVVAVEHIGSTALPGAWAKPIIDISVAVISLAEGQTLITLLKRLGYQNRSNRGFDDRIYFVKGSGTQHVTHHLNIVEPTSETAWLAPILFRDYLLAHPAALRAYNDLKLELAGRFAADRNAYTESKGDFVGAILKQAKQEQNLKPN